MTLHALTAPLPHAGHGLLAWLRTAWQRRSTLDALHSMDDHVLSDIGFVREPEAPRARLVA